MARKTRLVYVGFGSILIIAILVVSFRMLFPYYGWLNYQLKNEKLAVKYPKSWQVEHSEFVYPDGSTEEHVTLYGKPKNDFSIEILVSCEVGKFPVEESADSEPIHTLNKNLYINFGMTQPITHKGGLASGFTVSNSPEYLYSFIDSKNTKLGNNSCPIIIRAYYGPNGITTETSVSNIKHNPGYKTAIKILKSLSYRE